MALIPIHVGERTALVEKPEPSRCSVPGCHGPHWTNCDYPVKREGKDGACDARLCEHHVVILVVQAGELEACPAHSRFSRAKR